MVAGVGVVAVADLGEGLGVGIGWRPELANMILAMTGLGFVEVIAEGLAPGHQIPLPLVELRRRGVAVVPHGTRLSLGGAEFPDPERVGHLVRLATALEAPLVSEHIAFVRAGGREAGHLLPVPRTRDTLDVMVENVAAVAASLPVPLALEPVAALFEWPDAEMNEAEFVSELLERTDTLLLLDVANVYANAHNHGYDPGEFLDRLPLDRLAYVHVAGGVVKDGLYHDTHAHPVLPGVLDLLGRLRERTAVPAVLLERDARYPSAVEFETELIAIAAAAKCREWRPTADVG